MNTHAQLISATMILAYAAASSAIAANPPSAGMVVLNPSADSAISMSGSSRVEVPIVYVNSNSAKAVSGSGSATLATKTLKTCGGTNFSGSAGCTGSVVSASVPFADPMSGCTAPSTAAMTDLGSRSFSGGTHTVGPGYYSGGISLSGGASVTLSPGTYVLGGGGLNISSSTISGNGVTLIIMAGKMNLSGGSPAHLTPPTSGTYAGITIFQPSSNPSKLTLSGGSSMLITGTIYAPAAEVSLSGSSGVTGPAPAFGDFIVADTVSLSGSGTIKVGGNAPMPAVSLPTMPLCD